MYIQISHVLSDRSQPVSNKMYSSYQQYGASLFEDRMLRLYSTATYSINTLNHTDISNTADAFRFFEGISSALYIAGIYWVLYCQQPSRNCFDLMSKTQLVRKWATTETILSYGSPLCRTSYKPVKWKLEVFKTWEASHYLSFRTTN